MANFMQDSKRVVVRNINATSGIQLDTPTTLSFYIVERNSDTPFISIDYKIDKQSGRSKTPVVSWTSLPTVPTENHIYQFDVTLSGLTEADNISFTFKLIDTNGVESFVTISDIDIVT